MRQALSLRLGSPPGEPAIRTLVEIDRRRGSIGLQYATAPGQPARTSGALWLPPDQAEALVLALLGAVGEWRAHEDATPPWAVPVAREGAR